MTRKNLVEDHAELRTKLQIRNSQATRSPKAVVELLAKYDSELPLVLKKITAISLEDAEALAKHKGRLALSGLTVITTEVAEALAKHEGHLTLNGLRTINPKIAEALAKHRGPLFLTGLTAITTEAVDALAKHEGNQSIDISLSEGPGAIEIEGLDMSLAGDLSAIEISGVDTPGGGAPAADAAQSLAVADSLAGDLDLESLVAGSGLDDLASIVASGPASALGSGLFDKESGVANIDSGILIDADPGSNADPGSQLSNVDMEGALSLEGDEVKPWNIDLGEFLNDAEDDTFLVGLSDAACPFDLVDDDSSISMTSVDRSECLSSTFSYSGFSIFGEKTVLNIVILVLLAVVLCQVIALLLLFPLFSKLLYNALTVGI
jgi:hypothetical protein